MEAQGRMQQAILVKAALLFSALSAHVPAQSQVCLRVNQSVPQVRLVKVAVLFSRLSALALDLLILCSRRMSR